MAEPDRLSFSRIAIVGATGPAGRLLGEAFTTRGFAVRAISRRRDALDAAFPDAKAEKVPADALDDAAIRRAVEGCDLVVNAIGTPLEAIGTQLPAARNIRAAIRAADARGLHVSSSWAYLPVQYLPLDEIHPRSGGNSYIQARRDAEDAMLEAGAAVMHLPDFYGPQVHSSVLQQALADAAAEKAMNWIGGGEVAREHLYLPDGIRIIADLAMRPETYGERWMLPGAGGLTGKRAAEIAGNHLARKVKLRAASPWMLRILAMAMPSLRSFMPMVPHYAQPIRYDAGKLIGRLGTPDITPYEVGIPRTLDWMLARSEDERQ